MNIDYRSIAIYLDRKGLKPKEIQYEIDSVFGPNSYSYAAITRSIRMTSFSPSQSPYQKNEEKFVHEQKMELIRKTLKDFPFSSIRKIEELTGIPKTTVYRILTQDLGYVLKHLKWIPHFLNPSQKVSRIELSKRLLQVLQEARETDYNFFITGDESWFYLSTDAETQWLLPEEKPSKRIKKTIDSEKYMLSIFWNPHSFFVVKVLPSDAKFNGDYFINEILNPLYEIMINTGEEPQKKIILHYDNARPHTSRKVFEYLESHNMEKAPQPPFSPDIAPSDFYLFGYVKNKLAGRSFRSPDELLSAVNEILDQISPETLMKVFQSWEERLIKVIEQKGEYIE